MSVNKDLLQEQFANYERIAKSIIANLRRPRDIDISTKILKQCQEFATRATTLEVQEYTNEFMKYFLRVINWTDKFQPQNLYDVWYGPDSSATNQVVPAHWSEDKSTYMALKSMDDGSLLIYLGIARDPKTWVTDGLSKFNPENPHF